jgi:hypothetical protein
MLIPDEVKKKRKGSWNVLVLSVLGIYVWIKILSKRFSIWSTIFFKIIDFILDRFEKDIDFCSRKIKDFLFKKPELKEVLSLP